MSKAEATVEELVGMIERGELRLPEMQRGYVWRATRVRDLMDSLYRGYPSGAILVWETDESVPLRRAAVRQTTSPYQSTKLLLDGQQRLTSLSAVIRGEPIHVRGRKKPIELLFNLEHPDKLTLITEVNEDSNDDDDSDLRDANEDDLSARLNQMTFVVASKKLANNPNWISVTEVFNTDDNTRFIEQAGIDSFRDPKFDLYNKRLTRLRAIRKYVYRMDILERGLSYEEVTEIFVRVNSLGAKLRSSDLAMAQITAKWRDSLKIFEQFQKQCADDGFDLGLGIHTKNLIVHSTGQSRFHTVGQLKLSELEKGWTDSKEAMRFAIIFLKSNAGLDNPALLSSPFLMIALGYIGHLFDYTFSPQQQADLRYWLLAANAKGRFSRGSTETLLDQDLARIREKHDIRSVIDVLRTQFGRLDVQPGDLEGKNARSAYFKMMFLAFRDDGAKDWVSNLTISLSHSGRQHKLQFHHVFPKALMRDHYPPRLINDICNLAFIGGKTNRKLGKREPREYLREVLEKQGPDALTRQCIPTDPALWQIDRYPDFLRERRVLVSDRLNRYLDQAQQLNKS